MKLKFGKFKGRDIRDVDSDYLSWLVQQPKVYPDLKQAIREEFAHRESDYQEHTSVVSRKHPTPFTDGKLSSRSDLTGTTSSTNLSDATLGPAQYLVSTRQ